MLYPPRIVDLICAASCIAPATCAERILVDMSAPCSSIPGMTAKAGPQPPHLLVRAVRCVGVEVPMTYALGTSRGTLTKAPLLLIDLETDAGITGRSYL